MKLLVTGVSHKTAPVEVRERLAFREDTLPAALADLKSREGVSEAVNHMRRRKIQEIIAARVPAPTAEGG